MSRDWYPGNDKALLLAFDAGSTVEQLAEAHGRELDEIRERIATLRPEPASDPEAALRKFWTDVKGVSVERQDALIAQINAKAQPGAMVGPFVVGQTAVARRQQHRGQMPLDLD